MTTVDPAKARTTNPQSASKFRNRQHKAAPSSQGAPSKSDIVAKLLARPKGATVVEVTAATGWQAHSVRAFFSGLRKKGAVLEREIRKDGPSSYRLKPMAAKPPTPAATLVPAAYECRASANGNEA